MADDVVEDDCMDYMAELEECNEICTPPSVIQEAETAAQDLLPSKSRQRYERMYNEFMKWKETNGSKSFSERTLLAYFSE